MTGASRLRLLVVVAWVGYATIPNVIAQPAATFTGDIAPLLWAKCGDCHHPDGPAPFSLVSYDDVRARARQIVTVTKARYMPPWKPEPGAGDFVGSRRLTDADIALIARWVDAGAPEGDRSRLAPPPTWHRGWRNGTPDVILTLPEYTVPPADGADVFRNFVVDVPFSGRRYVRGVEFLPGNPSVHHANVFVDRTSASRQLDDDDPAPGYQGLIPYSAQFPDGHFLGWTPGQSAPLDPPQLAWALDGGSSLLVQLHLQPTGRAERIQPQIGLFLADTEPRDRIVPVMLRLGRQNLDIAAGDANYVVTDTFELPADAVVHAIQPHAHYRATTVRATATRPDGTNVPLLSIVRWDFNWQDRYQYARPVPLPKGTRLSLEYRFDNSAANPRNPSSPPARVVWGFRSGDEMADVWLQLTANSADDRARLAAAVDRKMTAEAIVGYETQIREHPDYVPTRNDVAVLYMDTDRPDLALPHFAHVVALEPQSAPAHFNLATALEATGQEDRAVDEYRRALQINPSYARAQERLARIYYNRAYVLDRQQRAVDAVAALREANAVRRDWPDALAQLAWLLANQPGADEAARAEAVDLASRAVALTHQSDASALDTLAATYARVGRLREAIETAETAERVALATAPALVSQIRARLATYRSAVK